MEKARRSLITHGLWLGEVLRFLERHKAKYDRVALGGFGHPGPPGRTVRGGVEQTTPKKPEEPSFGHPSQALENPATRSHLRGSLSMARALAG